MLSWFPIGKVIKVSVLLALVTAVGGVMKTNVKKLGRLFVGDSATEMSAARDLANGLNGLKMMIENSRRGPSDELDLGDEDYADSEYGDTGSNLTQALNLMRDGGIYSDLERTTEDEESGSDFLGPIIEQIREFVLSILSGDDEGLADTDDGEDRG
jgi:hypothetical protein